MERIWVLEARLLNSGPRFPYVLWGWRHVASSVQSLNFPSSKKGCYNIYLGQGLLIVTPWGDGKNVLKLDNAVSCTTLEIH